MICASVLSKRKVYKNQKFLYTLLDHVGNENTLGMSIFNEISLATAE